MNKSTGSEPLLWRSSIVSKTLKLCRKKGITEGQNLEAKRLVDEGEMSMATICERVVSYYRLVVHERGYSSLV